MNGPEVSVVMGVYNGADALEDTLHSIFGQAGCEFELIVVNDGSTDASAQILDEWSNRDPRLRVVHQENSGLTRALITGCREAQGGYIARQDAADVSLPGRLARQARVLRENPDLSFVSCHTRFVGPCREFLYVGSGTGLAKRPTDIIALTERHGVKDGPSHHGSVMFRRSTYHRVGAYRAQFYFGQDWDLWYRLAAAGNFLMLDEVLYEARLTVANISMNSKNQQEKLAQISRMCLEQRRNGRSESALLATASAIRPDGKGRRSRRTLSRAHYYIGSCLRRNGEQTRARSYFRKAIQDDPTNVKAWLRLLQT